MNASSSGVRRSNFKVAMGPTCWKMPFLSLLMQYLENYWTEFHQSYGIYAFWNKGERFNFGRQKFKGKGHSMTKNQLADVHRA